MRRQPQPLCAHSLAALRVSNASDVRVTALAAETLFHFNPGRPEMPAQAITPPPPQRLGLGRVPGPGPLPLPGVLSEPAAWLRGSTVTVTAVPMTESP
jgi:hypothetical protein